MRQLLYYFIHKQPRARLFNTQQVVGLVYNLTRCSSTISFWNQANIHVFSFQYPCNLWRQLVQYISIASFLRQVLIFFFYFFQIHLSIYTYSHIYIRNNGSLRRDWSWGYVFWLWIQHILLPVPMRWPVPGLCGQAHGWFGRYAHRRVS